MTMPARTLLAVCVAGGLFFAGAWYGRQSQNRPAVSGGRSILYYQDPMHPAYRSEKPGIAPDCGMQLEPVYAGGAGAAMPDQREPLPAGTVQISPAVQQRIAVTIETVARAAGSYTLRVPGRVTLDETRVYRVAAAVDGWVRTAGPIATGTIVQKDEVLATFYNRDFLTAQQTYLYALNTMDRFKDKESEEQLKLTRAQKQASEENLEFLGMGAAQLREIERTRQIAKNIELRSPVAGLVLARNAFAGLRFERGAELFRIADLDHIWILADVFEHEAHLINRAGSAAVRYQGRAFPVQMSRAIPQFDPASRALKVRLEMNNPGLVLRPDMFVDVELQVGLPPSVNVPVDAVLNSGLRKTVFVDLGGGYFEPRAVETGWSLGDRIQIVRGLEPGERIVTAGNFILDSETRMRAAAAPRPAAVGGVKDPVCGMDIDPAKGAGKSEHAGKTYYFCSPGCKEKFDKDPKKYAAPPQVAQVAGPSHD